MKQLCSYLCEVGLLLSGYLWLQRCKYFILKDLKCLRFYGIMAVAKKATSERSLRLVRGGASDMRFEVWPQFWPFTASDYVGIMDFVARKSTVFGQKSTEKHSKRGKRLLLLSLGARCCRFESCHFDHISTMVLIRNHRVFHFLKSLWYIASKLTARKPGVEDKTRPFTTHIKITKILLLKGIVSLSKGKLHCDYKSFSVIEKTLFLWYNVDDNSGLLTFIEVDK